MKSAQHYELDRRIKSSFIVFFLFPIFELNLKPYGSQDTSLISTKSLGHKEIFLFFRIFSLLHIILQN